MPTLISAHCSACMPSMHQGTDNIVLAIIAADFNPQPDFPVPTLKHHHPAVQVAINSNSFHTLPLLCALTQVALIAASCIPPALVLILSWSMVVVVGVACCCCIPFQFVLMLVLTFAPCTLTFAPCACGGSHRQQLTVVVFLPQPLTQRLPLYLRWFHYHLPWDDSSILP